MTQRPDALCPRPVLIRLVAFGTLVTLVFALYVVRPDAMQAVHWWPMVFWTPIVFLPFLSLRFRPLRRPFFAGLVVWGLALHLIREPSALLLAAVSRKQAGDWRVVTLNCAAGTAAAAREAFVQDADFVLLQEVGQREAFETAGLAAGYPFVSWSVDDAVFSRTPIARPTKAMDFAAGTIELRGHRLRVVALRLLPPVFRLDLWSLDAWREYAEDGVRRRNRIADLLQEARAEGPCLFGGDFNATNPRLVTDVRPETTEAGRAAGRGWRGTGTNDFPFVAVDQIWGSSEIGWTQAYARMTENSDHRMVVADFRLRDRP